MRWLIAGSGFVMLCLSLAPSLAGQTPRLEAIPVDKEPRHHIGFADSRLRVLQVNIPARDTTLDHRHDHDLATVNIQNGPTRTWSSAEGWSAVRAREVGGVNVTEYTGKASAHIVQTVGDFAYRLTGVENLRAGGWTTLGPINGDYLVMVTESRAFRAYEMRLPPAAKVTHTHPVPVVVTLVEGAITAGSAGTPALTVPGLWTVVAGALAHTVEAGGAGARVIEVEVR